ncbi:AAA family ATPase [Candidatus Acetothermia bacterium]|nr:AAA family ATPase [Candidatus Acetothermia bacterium]
MKLIFLYGPPAAGKLTVAQELAKLTGYKVFHNHLTIDLVGSIFEWGTRIFWQLVGKYRLELIEAAARERIPGLIFTFVYAKTSDDRFIKKIIRRVETHGGEVLFVQLCCRSTVLFRRLKKPSRNKFGKLTKITTLKAVMKQYELFAPVQYANNLSIDNTKLSAHRTAQIIQAHFALPKQPRSKQKN